MGTLDGRLALVTGASRGIGEHCARSLAQQGARVALAARSQDDLNKVAQDLPHDPVVIVADLAQQGAGVDLAHSAIEALGGVDILVNNAGVSEIRGEDEMVMRLNYHAPLETTKALVRQMAERGHGSVVHMSSIAGATGVAELPTYGATKAALDSLTRSQAAQFGKYGVRVNAVAPGLIITEMWEEGRKTPGLADGLAEHIALGRWGEPEEIGSVVAFLASDSAAYVTGQTIVVDGGFHAVTAWGDYL
ncbi:MAG: SDR family oxidoreductase [Actinomycetota bacterium]|nr:SDR family oxidoreductase [Actinomycetota bacterium]MEC9059379.1 SDR family oxidoreductase [Actinomycetota bacterium]